MGLHEVVRAAAAAAALDPGAPRALLHAASCAALLVGAGSSGGTKIAVVYLQRLYFHLDFM